MTAVLGRQRLERRGAEADPPDALVIGLVNNMPDGAIRSTEHQFLGLLNAASEGRKVRLERFYIPEVPRSDSARSDLLTGYAPVDEMFDTPLDALIVTGNEPKAPSLPEEPYWPALTRLVDWAEENTRSTVWSCLAAHAAVLHLDGVGRQAFPAKLSGVFQSTKTDDHAIVAGVPAHWPVPHSRQFGLASDELVAKGYRPLTNAGEAGVDIFIKQRQSLFLFFQGHLEYDAQSLFKEYLRDIQRYLNGERDAFPPLPSGYFDGATAESFELFRRRSLGDRHATSFADVPKQAAAAGLANHWRPAAVGIYRNWLSYVADAKSRHRRDL